MNNKAKTLDLTIRDSSSYKNFIAPDYPDYPDCDDIYNTHLDRNEIDSKYIFGIKASPQISKKHESIQKSY
ncbi:MAG: hypothetical protein AAB347_12240 [Bacteroidota bacterium]